MPEATPPPPYQQQQQQSMQIAPSRQQQVQQAQQQQQQQQQQKPSVKHQGDSASNKSQDSGIDSIEKPGTTYHTVTYNYDIVT